jgi:hypothetical protein
MRARMKEITGMHRDGQDKRKAKGKRVKGKKENISRRHCFFLTFYPLPFSLS